MSEKGEKALRISPSRRNFSQDEAKEITESFSKIVPVEQWWYVRKSEELLPAVIYFTLGAISGSIAVGFFEAMGTDLYQKAKEKVVKILKDKKDPSLQFKMLHNDVEISILCQSNDEVILEKVFDTIDKARDIAVEALNHKDVPEMNKLFVCYKGDWVLESGQNWKPPDVIEFYKFNRETGKWELTKKW